MAAILNSLVATGPNKSEARVDFRNPAMLVRGPSDTGKSYIRDCLWYLMGGEKTPKKIPEAIGYDSITLNLESDGVLYEIRRGLAGGDASVSKVHGEKREEEDLDPSELLVRLSGAVGKQLLRSKSKRGKVTGGDLRHWFLLSQPNMISEEATSGVGTNATQRIAAFHMFITGSDDSAIELAKTNDELAQISGQIIGAELSLQRVRADIPDGATRQDVSEALERVDFTLNSMTETYNSRASTLKEVRGKILVASSNLQKMQQERNHSIAMVERFELLEKKYISDSERLGATWEGMAMFKALDETPCPLCRTPSEIQPDPHHLLADTQKTYSKALKAEIEKINVLRDGLKIALFRERERVVFFSNEANMAREELNKLEQIESHQLQGTRHEFSGDPKTLALRRSELSEQLARFDDEARLLADIEQWKNAKKKKSIPVNRNVGHAPREVAKLAKAYLHEWGFNNILNVELDASVCDLVIDGRARLDFGAGKRALFLAALTVAVMDYAIQCKNPHLGFVVIDSPLKSYADPKNRENQDVDVGTVTSRFYNWLSMRDAPGQIVILENEEIQEPARSILNPLEFIGEGSGEGRRGFYPVPEASSISDLI